MGFGKTHMSDYNIYLLNAHVTSVNETTVIKKCDGILNLRQTKQ